VKRRGTEIEGEVKEDVSVRRKRMLGLDRGCHIRPRGWGGGWGGLGFGVTFNGGNQKGGDKGERRRTVTVPD